MIGIRADANSIIATGHMMRCITIARAIVMKGESVTFFMADKESERLLKSFAGDEFQGIVLGTDYRDMESELDNLEKELKDSNIKALLVDSYSVTKGYFERLSKICRVAYMDDLAKEAYPVDIVINYSGYSINMGYEKLYAGVGGFTAQDTRLLLGLKYAPLREQFYTKGDSITERQIAGQKEKTEKEKTESELMDSTCRDDGRIDVLLATGGSDMCNMITAVLERTKKTCGLYEKSDRANVAFATDALLSGANWHVVVGDFVENPEAIEECAKERNDVVLHRSVKNMADLMRQCDLAVLAAGTMLTECAAVGLPAIFYQVADNQKFNVEYFGGLKGMIFAGEVHPGDEKKRATIDKIFEELGKLVKDRNQLKAMGESLLEITDGRGAIRIADALMEEIR